MGSRSRFWAISQRWSGICLKTAHILPNCPPGISDTPYVKLLDVCRESLPATRTFFTGPVPAAGDDCLLGLKTLLSNHSCHQGARWPRQNVQHSAQMQIWRGDCLQQSIQRSKYHAFSEARHSQHMDALHQKRSLQAQVVRSSSSTSWMRKAREVLGRGGLKADEKLAATVKPSGSVAAASATPEGLKPAAGLYQTALAMATGKAGPLAQVRATSIRYREVAGLQVESFLRRNWLPIVGIAGVGTALLLWRLMFRTASLFVTISEGLAYWGFLGLSATIVTFLGLFLKRIYTINPDVVYRTIMRQLNSSAAALEVMGAPLAGTDLRAFVMSGGGVRFKRFRPRLATKRCYLVFPVRGSERRAIVSAEVKKKHGRYQFKLLALDVPTALAGQEQRLFLVGDQSVYDTAGTLIADLRDPLVEALKRQKEFDVEDEREDEEERRLWQEEKRRKAEEAAAKQKEKEDEEKRRGL